MLCLCVCLLSSYQLKTDFHEIWYKSYATGRHTMFFVRLYKGFYRLVLWFNCILVPHSCRVAGEVKFKSDVCL
jgi:hypothetical protein